MARGIKSFEEIVA